MVEFRHRAWTRLLVALVAAMTVFALDVGVTYSQSQNCSRLASGLRTLDRNSAFRNLGANSAKARALAADLQNAESAYVRDGCNAAAKAGQTLSRPCQTLARSIINGRAQLQELQSAVETGTAIAQQRETILQEIARFGCNVDGSSADVEGGGRKTLLEQLFGSDFATNGRDAPMPDGDIIGDEFQGFGSYNTVRTVCVRKCDGYYWPVSYSTLVDYAGNDALQCAEQCPGTEVELYYYSNPGQEAEQMVSLSGQPYMMLPNALRYRSTYDASCTCKAPVSLGSINVADMDGQSRAVINFGEASFPLPLRDPRSRPQAPVAAAAPLQTATLVDVPLPRPRPVREGEFAPAAVRTVDNSGDMRLVQFGDRTVRIVGPDTPYSQAGAAGT